MIFEDKDFPLYLMIINGQGKFLPLRRAGIIFDSGWDQVDTGGMVLNVDFTTRPMTREEEREISRIADEWSANK